MALVSNVTVNSRTTYHYPSVSHTYGNNADVISSYLHLEGSSFVIILDATRPSAAPAAAQTSDGIMTP